MATVPPPRKPSKLKNKRLSDHRGIDPLRTPLSFISSNYLELARGSFLQWFTYHTQRSLHFRSEWMPQGQKRKSSHRNTCARERVLSTSSTGYCRRHAGQCITPSAAAASPPPLPLWRLLPVVAGGGLAVLPLPLFLLLPLPPPVALFAVELGCSTPSSANCAAMTSSGLGGGLKRLVGVWGRNPVNDGLLLLFSHLTRATRRTQRGSPFFRRPVDTTPQKNLTVIKQQSSTR